MLLENFKLFFKQMNTKTEQTVARIMFNKSMKISVVESCTGGLISSRLTDIAGSSAFIKENYITYSNDAKMRVLGVNQETLTKYGAVSEQCATEMAEGLFNKLNSDGATCDVVLATTGIAGPGGATDTKPVGLMFVAVKTKYSLKAKKIELNPHYKRKTMKFLFSQKALEFLIECLKSE